MTTLPVECDLLVVGGGVLGTFHAYHAAARGLKTVLLERSPKPVGATVRNFGQVVPSGSSLHWQKFGRESLRIYKQISEHADISVRNEGSIYLASDEEEMTLLEELHQINKEQEYPSQLWNADACQQRYPALRRDYCIGGLFFPDEVSVNPRLMIYRLHDFLTKQVKIHYNAGVCGLDLDNDRVIATTLDQRSFSSEKVIVCSGCEFQLLYPDLFQQSDLKVVKLQMARLAPQSGLDIPGNVLTGLSIRRYESFSECPSWGEIKSREPSDNFAKQWGIHILFKQEADKSIILGDSHEYASVADRDQLGFDLREDINQFFVDEAAKIFELPDSKLQSSWAGFYCQTANPLGILKQTINDRIHIATGIGGKGMTSSAGFAQHHLAEIYND